MKRLLCIICTLLFILSSCVVPRQEASDSSGISFVTGSEFWIRFIDVGQADAALVCCDGEYMLIDGGNRQDSRLIYDILEREGVEKLKYAIATHAHEDHVGGVSGALAYCDAENVFCSVTYYDSQAFRNLVNMSAKHGREIKIPKIDELYSLGSARFKILAPREKYIDDENNSSIVLRIEYGKTSFLFTGDAELESELAMLEEGCELKSDVLKVGHHGSYTSTSYRFLREVMPEYAIISAGVGNDYGHPHDVILDRLSDADVKVYRTDASGDIICESDGISLSFTTEKGKK